MKGVLFFCVDALSVSTRKGAAHPDRVLVVRLDNIGDFVLWLHAAQATVEFYKAQGKSVVLVANAAWAVWAKELLVFDDVIALDVRKFGRGLLYRYRLGCEIRKLG